MSAGELNRRVRPLLNDARNRACSAHTRYSAACRALEVCCNTGIGDNTDRTTLSVWETRRCGEAMRQPPVERSVAAVVARVRALLENWRRA